MILTLDIDGVIAEMATCDLDPTKRTWTNYRNKQPHPKLDLKVLNRLLNSYHTYFVSARSFEGAADCTRVWLREIGVEVDKSLGVICAEGGASADWTSMSHLKSGVLSYLGSTVHVDDHPLIIESLQVPTVGVLFRNDHYDGNLKYFRGEATSKGILAEDWPEIEAIVKRVWEEELIKRHDERILQ
jgi:hypothetical protein